jgi:hypothetical protein
VRVDGLVEHAGKAHVAQSARVAGHNDHGDLIGQPFREFCVEVESIQVRKARIQNDSGRPILIDIPQHVDAIRHTDHRDASGGQGCSVELSELIVILHDENDSVPVTRNDWGHTATPIPSPNKTRLHPCRVTSIQAGTV